MRQKVISEEGENIYALEILNNSKLLLNSDILFIPNIDNSLTECYPSVHNVVLNSNENNEKFTNF